MKGAVHVVVEGGAVRYIARDWILNSRRNGKASKWVGTDWVVDISDIRIRTSTHAIRLLPLSYSHFSLSFSLSIFISSTLSLSLTQVTHPFIRFFLSPLGFSIDLSPVHLIPHTPIPPEKSLSRYFPRRKMKTC